MTGRLWSVARKSSSAEVFQERIAADLHRSSMLPQTFAQLDPSTSGGEPKVAKVWSPKRRCSTSRCSNSCSATFSTIKRQHDYDGWIGSDLVQAICRQDRRDAGPECGSRDDSVRLPSLGFIASGPKCDARGGCRSKRRGWQTCRVTESLTTPTAAGRLWPLWGIRRALMGIATKATRAASLRADGAEIAQIKTNARIKGYGTANQITQNLEVALADMRKKMTLKYQIEF